MVTTPLSWDVLGYYISMVIYSITGWNYTPEVAGSKSLDENNNGSWGWFSSNCWAEQLRGCATQQLSLAKNQDDIVSSEIGRFDLQSAPGQARGMAWHSALCPDNSAAVFHRRPLAANRRRSWRLRLMRRRLGLWLGKRSICSCMKRAWCIGYRPPQIYYIAWIRAAGLYKHRQSHLPLHQCQQAGSHTAELKLGSLNPSFSTAKMASSGFPDLGTSGVWNELKPWVWLKTRVPYLGWLNCIKLLHITHHYTICGSLDWSNFKEPYPYWSLWDKRRDLKMGRCLQVFQKRIHVRKKFRWIHVRQGIMLGFASQLCVANRTVL